MATSAPSSRHTCTLSARRRWRRHGPPPPARAGWRPSPPRRPVHEEHLARLEPGPVVQGDVRGLVGDVEPGASSLGNESGTGSAPEAWTTTRSANPPPSAGRANAGPRRRRGDALAHLLHDAAHLEPGRDRERGFCWYLLEQQDVGEVQGAGLDPRRRPGRAPAWGSTSSSRRTSIGSPSSWACQVRTGTGQESRRLGESGSW